MADNWEGLLDDVVRYSSYLIIAVSIAAFLVTIPDAFSPSFPLYGRSAAAYFVLPVKASFQLILFITISVGALALLSLLSMVMKRQAITKSFNPGNAADFFRYLVALVFVEIVVSELIAVLQPGLSNVYPFSSSNPAVVQVAYSSAAIFEGFFLELLPLGVILAAVLAIHHKLTLKSWLNYSPGTRENVIISIAVSIVVSVLSGGDPLAMFGNFLVFSMLNMIFLKHGFFRAFLANFSLSMTNVAATVLMFHHFLSLLLTLFILFLGFLGAVEIIGMFTRLGGGISTRTQPQRERKPIAAVERKIPLFIQSACPDCENTTFHVLAGMTLKCTRCGRELPKDTVGPANVRVEMVRNNRQ